MIIIAYCTQLNGQDINFYELAEGMVWIFPINKTGGGMVHLTRVFAVGGSTASYVNYV